jgi:hypothetical protein
VIINVDDFATALENAALAGTVTYLGVGPAAQALAGPGDIWVQGLGFPGTAPGAGQQHVGICLTTGCTMMISNDSWSPPCTFAWVTSPFIMEQAYLKNYHPSGYFHVK